MTCPRTVRAGSHLGGLVEHGQAGNGSLLLDEQLLQGEMGDDVIAHPVFAAPHLRKAGRAWLDGRPRARHPPMIRFAECSRNDSAMAEFLRRKVYRHDTASESTDFAYDADSHQLLLSTGELISAGRGRVVATWPVLDGCCRVRPKPGGGFVDVSKSRMIGVLGRGTVMPPPPSLQETLTMSDQEPTIREPDQIRRDCPTAHSSVGATAGRGSRPSWALPPTSSRTSTALPRSPNSTGMKWASSWQRSPRSRGSVEGRVWRTTRGTPGGEPGTGRGLQVDGVDGLFSSNQRRLGAF